MKHRPYRLIFLAGTQIGLLYRKQMNKVELNHFKVYLKYSIIKIIIRNP